jgi:DNA-binding response OmpR family regulator
VLEIRAKFDEGGAVDAPLTVLVVEDDPIYSQFVVDALRAAGHEVESAATAAIARERVRVQKPDAVMLDLGLPDESGYELARELRGELPPASVIILLTANMFPERDLAEAVGIDMVLSKPVDRAVVVGMVELVRERRRRKLVTR